MSTQEGQEGQGHNDENNGEFTFDLGHHYERYVDVSTGPLQESATFKADVFKPLEGRIERKQTRLLSYVIQDVRTILSSYQTGQYLLKVQAKAVLKTLENNQPEQLAVEMAKLTAKVQSVRQSQRLTYEAIRQ